MCSSDLDALAAREDRDVLEHRLAPVTEARGLDRRGVQRSAQLVDNESGQRFAFHGYAPVDASERAKQLKAWEQHSARHNQTQLLIETPYRNAAMFATLLASLKGDTKLCVARALTTADEWIATRTIADWKKQPAPQLDKMPTLFLYLAR